MVEWISKLATPGAVGIWTLVIMGMIGWWKGLPKVLDAFANRQSKVEERMGVLLETATARFTREIAAADERHDACLEGQRKLMDRVDVLERERSDDRKTIDGLMHKITQMQVSAIRTEGTVASPMIQAAMRSLDTIPSPE